MEGLLTSLLLQHNCVIIPDFGGFVASRVPAYMDEEKRKIYPPSKQLTFNSRLIKNDGLLVAALAEKEHISFDEALENIKSETTRIQQKLRKGQSHHIDNIGTLFTNEEGSINFRQDRYFNLLLDAYGLGAVEFIPSSQVKETKEENTPHMFIEKRKEKKEQTDNNKSIASLKEREDTIQLHQTSNVFSSKEETVQAEVSAKESDSQSVGEIAPISKNRRKFPVLKYAAAAVVLPLAFYSFWIPMTSDFLESKVLFKQDFNPFKEKKAPVYSAKTIDDLKKEEFKANTELEDLEKNLPGHVDVFHYDLVDGVYAPVWRKNITKNNVNQMKAEPSNGSVVKAQNANYHLIAGCFREIDNAHGLIEELNSKGFNAYILDKKDGLHRVTATQLNYKTEIENKKSLLNQVGYKTWVLKK
jgi:hypothetical protein